MGRFAMEFFNPTGLAKYIPKENKLLMTLGMLRACAFMYNHMVTDHRRCTNLEELDSLIEFAQTEDLTYVRDRMEELHHRRRAIKLNTEPFTFTVTSEGVNFFVNLGNDALIGFDHSDSHYTLELIEKTPLQRWLRPTVQLRYRSAITDHMLGATLIQKEVPAPQKLLAFKALAQALNESARMPLPGVFEELNQQLQRH